MNAVQKIAGAYIVALAAAGYGFAVGKYRIFPYQWLEKRVEELRAFVSSSDLEPDKSVIDKLFNDFGLEPRRFMFPYPRQLTEGATAVDVQDLKKRRERPQLTLAADHPPGYVAVFGALDLNSTFWGGLLLNADGKVIHTWRMGTSHLKTSKVREELKTLYGIHLYADGSVIYTESEEGDGDIGAGGGLVKIDACSNIVWNNEGEFHHVVAPAEEGRFWTIMGKQTDFDHKLALLSADTGQIVRVIDMKDVRKANPHVSIFNLQKDVYALDISHGNDIDVLPRRLATQFPMFRAGDLLISYRTQNLVFVLDPDTLKVKWWRIGAWDRQHDADWEADGLITVFSNNQANGRPFSDIVAIDPSNMEYKVLIDGTAQQLKSDFNATQELTDFGTRVIASSLQGVVVEIDAQGKSVFNFVNTYNAADGQALQVSEAARYKEDFFTKPFWNECAKP